MKKLAPFCFALLCGVMLHAQCYTVAQTAYVADTTSYSSQIVPQIQDDQWSQKIPIGFTFCFYGAQYDTLLVGTNGIVTFDTSLAGDYCQWPIPSSVFPSPTLPKNTIMGVWHDLQLYQIPATRIYCWTSGVSPSRTFTVKFDSIPMYSCTSSFYSGRIILHETTNEIEVQVENKSACFWNSGKAILGIQNQTGLMGISPAPYNSTTSGWTMSQMGWLFTPICNVCQGVGVNESENRKGISVFPNPSTGNFTLQIQNENSSAASYDVIDISGRVIYSANISAHQQVQFTLENSGMYFVRVFDAIGTVQLIEKVVVE